MTDDPSGLARHLAAMTGRPATEWERVLDAYDVARLDTFPLLTAITRGVKIDPAREAEAVETSFRYAHGQLADELAELRRRIYATLPRRLRRLAQGPRR